jgi:hypothetical protein
MTQDWYVLGNASIEFARDFCDATEEARQLCCRNNNFVKIKTENRRRWAQRRPCRTKKDNRLTWYRLRISSSGGRHAQASYVDACDHCQWDRPTVIDSIGYRLFPSAFSFDVPCIGPCLHPRLFSFSFFSPPQSSLLRQLSGQSRLPVPVPVSPVSQFSVVGIPRGVPLLCVFPT